jgi:predicted transposase/invertase (TIGR01784 family)
MLQKPLQNFRKINPVIFIGVLGNFTIDLDEHFVCHHNIRNVTTNKQLLKHMDFYFLELEKFNKKETELVTPIDRWAFLLKQSGVLDHIPTQIQNDKPVQHALTELDRVGWTQQDLDAYRLSLEIFYESDNAKEAWIEAGKAKGAFEEKCLIARQMLAKKIDITIIADVTSLSVEEIQKL